jgi:outer membrane protein OmpU
MATCSAELVWQTVAFLHQIEAPLVGRAWQSLQNTPETRQESFIRRADYRCGYLSFNFEEKKMKNVLLATTAIALTAGYAAAEMSISASAKIAYGNFGEEWSAGDANKTTTNDDGQTANNATNDNLYAKVNDASVSAAGAGYSYSETFDVVVSGSGEAGGIAYSGSMTIDEDAASNSVGTLSMSTGGFTLAYGDDDFGDLVADNANGLEEAAGDILLSYAANGISASYEMDQASTSPYYMRAGYTNGALTVGLEVADTDGSGSGKAVNTISLGYTMGALTVSYDADDKASVAGDNSTGSDYDAKITYTMGDTVLSAGTDEVSAHYAGIATTVGGLTLTMRTEQDGKKCNNGGSACASGTAANAPLSTSENELSLSYTMGALTVAYAKDTGDKGKFGDEAETLTTLTYDLGGVTLVAKGNDQDETEVSAAFSF